uniref:Neuronal pentraxin receptor a n=1 Tax=Scleropages formosus TaxID=113540 RepID=A0A8C9R8E6_SCLFO
DRAPHVATLKFLVVVLAAGMLAFLGAVICIIAAVHPGFASSERDSLRAAAEELRHTVLRQKEQILSEQRSIQELTAKLSECERSGGAMAGDHSPASPGQLEELERAVVRLKDRIERLEVRAGGRIDGVGVGGGGGHLLEPLSRIQKGLGVVSGTGGDPEGELGHRHELEEGIDTLQQRIAELEQGLSEQTYPEGYKLSFPVRTDYMYGVVRHPIPELYAFTTCLWLRTKDGGIGTPFSYAVPDQPNELVLLRGVHNPVELLVNDRVAQLPLSLRPGIWEHICVSWSLRDGVWQAFQGGQLKGEGEGLAAWHPISPGGVLVLGQEQDAMGGRFDASQALVGELSQFNLWDRVLSPAEIAGLADCSAAFLGNVVPWTDRGVGVFGGAAKESPEACREPAGARK